MARMATIYVTMDAEVRAAIQQAKEARASIRFPLEQALTLLTGLDGATLEQVGQRVDTACERIMEALDIVRESEKAN